MSETGTIIFVAGDQARYEGMAMTWGECLSPGDVVTVVTPNEDPEDDCIVEFRCCQIAVSAPDLTWLESGAL